MKLSALFDGETHHLRPDEDFGSKVVQAIVGFEASDDDEILGTWESETLHPVLEDRSGGYGKVTLPGFDAQQGWGSFALAMNSLCRALGVDREQYQHNDYSPDGKTFIGSRYTFRLKLTGAEHWQGGRL